MARSLAQDMGGACSAFLLSHALFLFLNLWCSQAQYTVQAHDSFELASALRNASRLSQNESTSTTVQLLLHDWVQCQLRCLPLQSALFPLVKSVERFHDVFLQLILGSAPPGLSISEIFGLLQGTQNMTQSSDFFTLDRRDWVGRGPVYMWPGQRVRLTAGKGEKCRPGVLFQPHQDSRQHGQHYLTDVRCCLPCSTKGHAGLCWDDSRHCAEAGVVLGD